jgi:cytochrome c oxidase subunit 3
MFFVIYFCLTGLHGIHMVIGLGLIGVYLFHSWRGMFTLGANDQPVNCLAFTGTFVDIVWVFLYPLLYLIPVAHMVSAASH